LALKEGGRYVEGLWGVFDEGFVGGESE